MNKFPNRRMLWIAYLVVTSFLCTTTQSQQQGQNFYYAGADNRQQARFVPLQQNQFAPASQGFAGYFPQTNAGPFLPFRSASNFHLADGNSVAGQKFQSQQFGASFAPSQPAVVPSDPRFDSLISSPGSFSGAPGGSNDDYAETRYQEAIPEVPSQRFNSVNQDRQSVSFRGNQLSRFPSVAVSEVTRTQDSPSNPNVLQTHSFNVHHTSSSSHPASRHTEELPLATNNRWRSQGTPPHPEAGAFSFRARNIPFPQFTSKSEATSVADVAEDVFPKLSNRFGSKERTFLVNTQKPVSIDSQESQPESDSSVPQYVAYDSYFPTPADRKNKELKTSSNTARAKSNTGNIPPTTYSPFILLDNRIRNTPPATEPPIDVVTTIRPSTQLRNNNSNSRGRNKYNRPTSNVDNKAGKGTGVAAAAAAAAPRPKGKVATTQTRAANGENTNFDVVTMSQDHQFVSEDNFKEFVDTAVIDSTEAPTTEDLKGLSDTVASVPASHAPIEKKVLTGGETKTPAVDRARATTTERSRKSTTARATETPSTSTEGWIIVASVQTSRSVSGARFIPSSAIKQDQHPLPSDVKSIKDIRDIKSSQANSKPVPDTVHSESVSDSKASPKANATTKASATLSTESIIDKLDQVQSELSSGILSAFPSQEKHSLDIPIVSTTTRSADATSTTENPSSEETFSRRFVPSSKTTAKPKLDRNKSLFDSVQFDDLTGLLPAGFKARGFVPNKATSSGTKTTKSLDLSSTSGSTVASTTTTTTSPEKPNRKDVKNKSNSLADLKFKIKFDDVSAFLPAGYKPPAEESSIPPSTTLEGRPESSKSVTTTRAPLEKVVPAILSKAKPVDISAFLPPGFKLQDSTETSTKLSSLSSKVTPKESNDLMTSEHATEEAKTTVKPEGSGSKIVFPSRPGANKKPQSSAPKNGGSAGKPIIPSHQIPTIHKGWPIRATTEFAGWPTPSPSPISIEKILQSYKESAAKETSSDMPESSTPSIPTSTAPTTTTRKTTTPGICSHDCDLAGSIKLVDGVKWVPELLDHNTKEWRTLANDVQHQLEVIFQSSEILSKWYRRIAVDAFSEGSVVVDYFLELSDLGRTVNTADMKRYLHDTLVQEMVTSNSFGSSNNSDYRQLKLGKYTVDPSYIDFVVLPRSVMPAVRMTEQEAWLPQWAIAVIVIGLASLCFVIIFGITVIISKHKNSKKHPTALTEEMLNELNKSHMGGFENYGAEDLYNMEDVWNEKPFKKRSSYYQEGSMPNIYDSWRSDWNGYYGNSHYNESVRSGYSRRRSDYDTNF